MAHRRNRDKVYSHWCDVVSSPCGVASLQPVWTAAPGTSWRSAADASALTITLGVLLRLLTVLLLRCAHRGFRISAATLQLTHISKGPTASAYQLRDTSILTVFSHHFVHRDGHDSLLTFFGAGDATSCWSEVDISSVAWHPVVPGRVIDFSNRDNHKYEL